MSRTQEKSPEFGRAELSSHFPFVLTAINLFNIIFITRLMNVAGRALPPTATLVRKQ
jgi:hypothetical protein